MKRTKRIVKLKPTRYDCLDCGPGIRVDEDACCGACGRQTVIVQLGVPDYSLVLAGMEAEDQESNRLRLEVIALTARLGVVSAP